MKHTAGILADFVDRGVDGEAGRVDAVLALGKLVAVEVDLDQARCGDLIEHQAVGVDQEMMLRPRQACGDMRIDQIVPAIIGDQTVARRKIDPLVPFGIRHSRRHFLQASFRWRHDCFSRCMVDFRIKSNLAAVLQQARGRRGSHASG